MSKEEREKEKKGGKGHQAKRNTNVALMGREVMLLTTERKR